LSKSKFNVNNTKKGKEERTYESILFDSKLEMEYYKDVLLPSFNKGEIINIVLQPKYTLQSSYYKKGIKILPIDYVADFLVKYANGDEIIVDVKGMPDTTAILKRKMFDYIYPEKKLVWLSKSKIDGGWISYDDLKKNRAIRRKIKKQKKSNVKL
jgi:hypothetical protein